MRQLKPPPARLVEEFIRVKHFVGRFAPMAIAPDHDQTSRNHSNARVLAIV